MDKSLKITTPSEREIAMIRVFDAPRALVLEAMTKPELIQRWLLGPDGWTMIVCDVDLRVGGRYRYVWRRDATGEEMGMGGVHVAVERPERLVVTEGTVKVHLSMVYRALGARNRTDALCRLFDAQAASALAAP